MNQIETLRNKLKMSCKGRMTGNEKRILVLGSGGAGKSTLSRTLEAQLDLPLEHLDKHYWNPGWVETSLPKWREKVTTICKRDCWIMDGNFSDTYDLRFPRAELIIILDIPRLTCIRRAVWRAISERYSVRTDMAEGCQESFDFEFYKWDYPLRTIPKTLGALEKYQAWDRALVLQSDEDIQSLTRSIQEKIPNG